MRPVQKAAQKDLERPTSDFLRKGLPAAAYLARKANQPRPVELLTADLAHLKVREWLRREIWNLLRQAGLVISDEPPPSSQPSTLKPRLTVVRPDDPEQP